MANVDQIIGCDGQVKNNVDDDDDGDDGDHDDDDDDDDLNNDGEWQILIKTLAVMDRSINLIFIMMILTIRVWIANLSSTCSPTPPSVQNST